MNRHSHKTAMFFILAAILVMGTGVANTLAESQLTEKEPLYKQSVCHFVCGPMSKKSDDCAKTF